MAIVYSNRIIEIAAVGTVGTKPHVNVWHMWFDSELGTDTKVAVVEDFRNNWQDHVMSFLADSYKIQEFAWRSLDTNDASNGVVQPDGVKRTQGALAEPALPPNVALLIEKNTDNRPRGRRDGRSFLGGYPEGRTGQAGELLAADITTINTALAAFYNGISDTSGSASGDRYPAVLETTPASRAKGTTAVTIGSRRVTSITVDPVVSTQRDRLR